jgi:hypothetical protein
MLFLEGGPILYQPWIRSSRICCSVSNRLKEEEASYSRVSSPFRLKRLSMLLQVHCSRRTVTTTNASSVK